eukprot:EG_transcript_19201
MPNPPLQPVQQRIIPNHLLLAEGVPLLLRGPEDLNCHNQGGAKTPIGKRRFPGLKPTRQLFWNPIHSPTCRTRTPTLIENGNPYPSHTQTLIYGWKKCQIFLHLATPWPRRRRAEPRQASSVHLANLNCRPPVGAPLCRLQQL